MKKNLRPGYAKYFVAIVPPSPVYENIIELKNYFRENYSSKAALNSPPHITLHMPFLWKEQKESFLVGALNDFSKGKNIFSLQLFGFGVFAPRVVFIDVKKNEWLQGLQQELHRFFKIELNLFNARYKDLPFHPHITLAFRDLKKPAFVKAWNEFREKEWEGNFEVNQITLLKHDGGLWQPLHHFHF
ncbi:MAG: 2'-5' RNA ligase family protein [Bacteroidetes bacterium]|nr:2'-5' RNA ligase family protein [Bacteroidota bacterium]